MQVIQIRGNNASGKTTSVRQFVENNNLRLEEVDVKGIKTNICTGENVVVLGRYDKKTGGCDRFRGREHVLSTIIWVIKNIKPDTIVFEGVIYSFTYTFASVVRAAVKRYGYGYKGICLYCPLDITFERLYNRNGGKPVNEEAIKLQARNLYVSYKRLLNSGVDMEMLDTSKIDLEEMHTIIEGAINGNNADLIALSERGAI